MALLMATTDSSLELLNLTGKQEIIGFIVVTYHEDRNVPTHARQLFTDAVIKGANENQFQIFLPVFSVICVLMIIGLPGNFIALLVYQQKLRKAIARQFLMTLCACGFLTCAVVMPFELDIMRHFFLYQQPWLCKFLRFFAYTVNNISSLTLLAIAAERYRIICNPWKQSFSEALSRRICYANLVIAVLASVPMAFVYGTQNLRLTPFPPGLESPIVLGCGKNGQECNYSRTNEDSDFVYGKSCLMDDSLKGSKFPMIIVAVYIASIILEFLILIAFYSQVTRMLSRRRRESMCQQKTQCKRSALKRVVRVTVMTVVLTCIYELCYLPCLTAVCIRLAHPDLYNTLSTSGKMAFNLSLKSYLLNSALYPFIYCFYNNEFRKGLFKLFRSAKSVFTPTESLNDGLSRTSRAERSQNSIM